MTPFRDRARSDGLPEDEVERWLGTVRPCVSLDTAECVPPGSPPAGRIGGLPPLPEDEPVPDLPFLVMVDFAAIPPDATDLPLPKDGTLLFFADTDDDPWGDDREWSRLVYVPAGTPVSERAAGGEWPPQVHPARDLHVTLDPSLPNRGSDTEEFPHGSALGTVWWYTGSEMQTGGVVQLGGYPWQWNDDPVNDRDRGPGDWVLLAEVGGENLTEGDQGIVYWVIRRDDLAAGRFTEARACYDMVG
ncbi:MULTISPECIES: DUF1963 domain-containing protein [unclassified Streptomyces]|uniref:DUF1963 domain-containing protein n=1 Tax=unclassified Streptomyces TaxID=2593676 RepID=UPI00324A030C